jgi:hypothetical protein
MAAISRGLRSLSDDTPGRRLNNLLVRAIRIGVRRHVTENEIVRTYFGLDNTPTDSTSSARPTNRFHLTPGGAKACETRVGLPGANGCNPFGIRILQRRIHLQFPRVSRPLSPSFPLGYNDRFSNFCFACRRESHACLGHSFICIVIATTASWMVQARSKGSSTAPKNSA